MGFYEREVLPRIVDVALGGKQFDRLRARVAGRLEGEVLEIAVEYVGLDGERLPIEDQSVDQVLTTWTLCTIPDVDRAVAEIHRVLRPGGSLQFLEHGRAPDAKVQRWQDRITPLQRRVAGGCHLNRAIDSTLSDAGLHIERLDNYYIKGPKVFGYMYEGTATRRE